MSQGRRTALTIHLTPAERQTLQAWQRTTTMPMGLVRRGRMLLLRDAGWSISQIARMVGINRRFVYKWVRRFWAQGVEGLADQPGRGRRRTPALTAEEGRG